MIESEAPSGGTKSSIKLAVFVSILSSFFFASTLALSKRSVFSCSTNMIFFFKGLFAMIPTVGFILLKKKEQSFFQYLRTDRIGIHLIRGIGGILTVYLFLFSLRTVSIAQTTLFCNTTPLFVPIIAYLWNRSKIPSVVWIGLFTAFVGMFFLLQPETGYQTGSWIALGCGVVGAVTIVTVRISHATEPLLRTVFYYNLFSLLVSGTLYFAEPSSAPLSPPVILSLVGIAVSGFLSQFFFTLSVKYTSAKLASSISYTAVIFSFVFDMLLGRSEISPSEIGGMLLILLGIFFVTFSIQKAKERQRITESQDS